MWAYSVEPVRARGLKHYWTMVFHYFCGSREFAGYHGVSRGIKKIYLVTAGDNDKMSTVPE